MRAAEIVARATLAMGESQRAFGERLGVSRRTMTRWVTGKKRARREPSHRDGAARLPPRPRLPRGADRVGGRGTAREPGDRRLHSPPPAPLPPPPGAAAPARVLSAAQLVDGVVCAAAEAMDLSPRALRPALPRRVQKKARELRHDAGSGRASPGGEGAGALIFFRDIGRARSLPVGSTRSLKRASRRGDHAPCPCFSAIRPMCPIRLSGLALLLRRLPRRAPGRSLAPDLDRCSLVGGAASRGRPRIRRLLRRAAARGARARRSARHRRGPASASRRVTRAARGGQRLRDVVGKSFAATTEPPARFAQSAASCPRFCGNDSACQTASGEACEQVSLASSPPWCVSRPRTA